VVGGVAYYGAIKTISTQAIPASPPEVDTGDADSVTENSFVVENNEVLDNGVPSGDGDMKEYGILWTTSPSLATTSNMKFSTVSTLPSGIFKDSSTTGYPGEGSVWDKNATGLPQDTQVYYRAFARNGTTTASIGYGDIRFQQTAGPIIVNLSLVSSPPIEPGGTSSFEAQLTTSKPITTGSFCINIGATSRSATSVALPKPISAISCVKRNTLTCAETLTNAPALSAPYNVSDADITTIRIDATTTYDPSVYSFCVRALSNLANCNINYCNNTKVELVSIVNASGINVALGGARTLCAYNTTNSCIGNGGGIILDGP
jgi:hypothetical protein